MGVGYNLTLVMQQPNGSQNPPSPGPHTPAANGTSPSPAPAPASPLTSAADTARSHVPAADASCAAAALALARCHVPGAELLSAAGAEVVLRLPREAAGAFPPLLRALAGAEGRAAGVASFGLSVTTLEVGPPRISNLPNLAHSLRAEYMSGVLTYACMSTRVSSCCRVA